MTFEEFRKEAEGINIKTNPKSILTEDKLLYASKLRYESLHHNFDSGYDYLYSILSNPYCDKSTALQLYWMNRPLYFLNNPNANDSIHSESLKFKQYLEEKFKSEYFPVVLKFNPFDFAINMMGELEELKSKENHLNELPPECFRAINRDSTILTMFKKIPKNASLEGIRTLYLFEFEEFKKLEKIEGIQKIEEVVISTNPYNKKKPKPRKFEELVSLKNVQKLHLSYYSKFGNIKFLKEFKNLTNLMINIESSEISDLSQLSKLDTLTYTNPKAESISEIAMMTNLEKLVIKSCPKLIDLSGIQELVNLTELKVSLSKKLKDISPIQKLNLKTLLFKEVEISNRKIDVIKNMPLETIQLDCKKLTNLDFIKAESKIADSLKNIYLYRLGSSEILKNKIGEYDLSKYNVQEVEMNNSL